MYPRLFDVPVLNVYGICIVIGIICCFVVVRLFARWKNGLPCWVDFCEANAYVAIGSGFFVAMAGQGLFRYIANPAGGFHITYTSVTFICGLIGGVVSFLLGYLLIGRQKYGPRLLEVLAIAPACIVIAHAWGRVGCFFAGCCHGKRTDSILGVAFPHIEHRVYPTQLFEAVFLFLLFGVLFFLAVRRDVVQGFAVYMLAYGTFRFGIEFIRGDDRGAFVGSLSPSQFFSVLLVVGAPVVYLVTKRMAIAYRENGMLTHKILPEGRRK